MLLRVTDFEPNALNTNDFFSQPSVSQYNTIQVPLGIIYINQEVTCFTKTTTSNFDLS